METPQESYPKLAKALKVKGIYLKREDLNPYGSHKGRSIPLMIEKYIEDNFKNFVISSSGNAALAAIRKVKQVKEDVELKVFIGKKIGKGKENRLKQEIGNLNKIKIKKTERPKQTAFNLGKEDNIVYLRQSTDDLALDGYKNLAKELAKIEDLQAIFIPTSSGTTAQGLYEGFKKLKPDPEIHIVQTEYCHPIAKEFDRNFEQKNSSKADAIVDKVAHRKKEVVKSVKESDGSGWISSDEDIKKAKELIQKITDLKISSNSALSVAGIKKAVKNDWSWEGTVVCLICGS